MKENECCKTGKTKKESQGFLAGLIYGLLPHTGCIAFIIFAILGVTTATALIKPLLLNPYFFYILIGVSLVFATISALVYLRRTGHLSADGAKYKWKYLSVLYGTTVGVNLVLFLLIFPIAANFTSAAQEGKAGLSEMSLKVDIPCPGHAPLISGELRTINGVESVNFRFPDYFDVKYDAGVASREDILSLDVFSAYPAEVISFSNYETAVPEQAAKASSSNGACGGVCSISQ